MTTAIRHGQRHEAALLAIREFETVRGDLERLLRKLSDTSLAPAAWDAALERVRTQTTDLRAFVSAIQEAG